MRLAMPCQKNAVGFGVGWTAGRKSDQGLPARRPLFVQDTPQDDTLLRQTPPQLILEQVARLRQLLRLIL